MLKNIIKEFMSFAGGSNIILKSCKYFNRNNLIILYYHRISKPGDETYVKDKNMFTQYADFEKQMKFIKANYSTIGESAIISAMEEQCDLPSYSIWVTFDDGFKDNYINAYPILNSLNIAATFFITTGFINQQVMPPVDTYNIGSKDLPNLFMSWEDIKDLKKNGFSIGCHSVNHKILSKITPNECADEIIRSKNEIEDKINEKVYSFAYPYGHEADIDFSIHPKILDRYGFKLAVTTLSKTNPEKLWANRFALRRIGFIYKEDFNIFRFKLASGCFWQK